MSQPQDGGDAAARRAQIEAVLADYPHLDEEQLAALIAWFRKEASAFDVAMLASNEALAEPYRRFRADHVDPMTGKDWMKGLLFAAICGAGVFLMVWPVL